LCLERDDTSLKKKSQRSHKINYHIIVVPRSQIPLGGTEKERQPTRPPTAYVMYWVINGWGISKLWLKANG
jgi:hypothetical protein